MSLLSGAVQTCRQPMRVVKRVTCEQGDAPLSVNVSNTLHIRYTVVAGPTLVRSGVNLPEWEAATDASVRANKP